MIPYFPPLDAVLSQLGETAERPLDAATSLPPSIYWRKDIADLERERIFRQDWVCAGLAADLPKTGDYLTFSVADEPVFCVRDRNGDIRTFANVCRHRMMRLVDGAGSASRIVCPYHAWTYDLDGRLIGAGQMKSSKNFDKAKICLPEVRTEIWQGWIYITLNSHARPIAELLAPLENAVGRYRMADYVPIARQDHVWQTNWKLLTENFMEGYHLPVAHKETVGAWFPVRETRFPEETFEAFTYQTFAKAETASYGCAHADNSSLVGDWRHTSVMPTVFPCHMYVLAPDHLWYLSLRPNGVGEVNVRFGAALAPEVHAGLN
ncbi:MAG: aromatic ring-hydroxylating oxygenase subunit alpha, partial [Geminicoccales bacterium]